MIKRRKALQIALAAALAKPSSAVQDEPSIIDCHTHFYDPTRPEGVPWPSKDSPLFRPVYPDHWHALAAPHGIHETVVVEASKVLQDNDWI